MVINTVLSVLIKLTGDLKVSREPLVACDDLVGIRLGLMVI